jgi:hypothetical protein
MLPPPAAELIVIEVVSVPLSAKENVVLVPGMKLTLAR